MEVVVDLDLIKRIKCLIITLVVSTTNQEKLLGVWILHTLEIVRKTTIVVRLHLDCLNSLVLDVELVYILRILLQEMHDVDSWSRIPVSTHIEYWSVDNDRRSLLSNRITR